MSQTTDNACHLVVRFADLISGLNTIKVHQDIIARHNAVWMGKFGKPLGTSKIRVLNNQIKKRIPTYIFLVTKIKGKYYWYKGTLLHIADESPTTQKGLIPRYYQEHNLLRLISLWMKLSNIDESSASDLKELYVTSSGHPLSETICGSMAGLFLVQYGSPQKKLYEMITENNIS